MKKEDFLNKLRKNTHVQFDMPAVDVKGIQYEDTLKQFIEMTESVGGHVIEAKEGESLDELVKKAYPEAKVFASHLPEITIAQKNPDTVAEANDLNGTDVGIVRGEVGVAENGCVWIPQTMKEKAVLFISEYIVIFLEKEKIVNNMHEHMLESKWIRSTTSVPSSVVLPRLPILSRLWLWVRKLLVV